MLPQTFYINFFITPVLTESYKNGSKNSLHGQNICFSKSAHKSIILLIQGAKSKTSNTSKINSNNAKLRQNPKGLRSINGCEAFLSSND